MKAFKFSDCEYKDFIILANTQRGAIKECRYKFQIRGRLRIVNREFFGIDRTTYMLDDSAAYSEGNYTFTLERVKQ